RRRPALEGFAGWRRQTPMSAPSGMRAAPQAIQRVLRTRPPPLPFAATGAGRTSADQPVSMFTRLTLASPSVALARSTAAADPGGDAAGRNDARILREGNMAVQRCDTSPVARRPWT